MFIKCQNNNIIFTLSDKGLLKGVIYTKDVYIDGKFFGINIYGQKLFKKYLLGTYEEDEAEQIVQEIYTLLKAGEQFYSMPDPVLNPEDLGVSL